MKKLPMAPAPALFLILFSAVIFFASCQQGQNVTKKDFEVKGNVQITNNCGGQIPDTIIVKFHFFDDAKAQIDKDTCLVLIKDGFYPFKKTSNVDETSKRCRIVEVTDFNGKPICEAARNVACKQPQKCKGTLSNAQTVDIGKLMLCDVTCNCAN